jgi:hypothetical protein
MLISLVLLLLFRARLGAPTTVQVVVFSAVVGAAILFWRLAGNVAQLNDDPIPLVSPNDLLCPVVTYVALSLAAAFLPPRPMERWERVRAVLTVVAFGVNVVFI